MSGTVATDGWVRVGAYAPIVDEDDRLLLVRGAANGDGPGQWWMPGGGRRHAVQLAWRDS